MLDISSQIGHFFSIVQVGILNDMKHVRLTPLIADEPASLGFQFQEFDIALPHPIISKSTFSVQFVRVENDGEPYIILDMIDENYLFITLRIDLTHFLVGDFRKGLSLDKYSDWVNIAVPYSFELRSAPYLLEALNPFEIIVSMKDGGLLHFKRVLPLASFDIFSFSEVVPFVSLNFMSSIFSSHTSQEPTNNVSGNAVADLVWLGDRHFASVCVNKTVKIWDLVSHKQVLQIPDIKPETASLAWLSEVPNKYLQKHVAGDKTWLTALLPNHETSDPRHLSYKFHTWVIDNQRLCNYSTFDIDENYVPNDLRKSDLLGFRIQDFHAVDQVDDTLFYVLWKSNTFSSIATYVVNKKTNCLTSMRSSLSPKLPSIADMSSHRENEYYLNLIFNSGLCDERIIATTLGVMSSKPWSHQRHSDLFASRQQVTQTVASMSKEMGVLESSVWHKFLMIALEFRKKSYEALSIYAFRDIILCAEVNGVGICRKAHVFEQISVSNKKLSKLLQVINSKFSSKTSRKLVQDFMDLREIDASEAGRLALAFIGPRITDEEVLAIMTELDAIPDVLEEILILINGGSESYDDGSIPATSPGEGLGLLCKLATVENFETIRIIHESVLTDMAMLLLLCEANDVILDVLNRVLSRLRIYKLMSEILDLCFESTLSSSPLERNTVSAKENSLFWVIARRVDSRLLSLISAKQYNRAFDFFTGEILAKQYNDFVLDAVLELLDRDEGRVLLNQFIPKFQMENAQDKFLTGLILLVSGDIDGFYDISVDYSMFEDVNASASKDKFLAFSNNDSYLKDFLHAIFTPHQSEAVTKANYYHQLSQLLKAHGSDRSQIPIDDGIDKSLIKSLELENMAIKCLEALGKALVTSLMTLYLRNHFNDALAIKRFDEAIATLNRIQQYVSKSDFEFLLRNLIQSLCANNDISHAISKDQDLIFSRNYLLIDTILLELANNDLVLINALKCYEYLYAWRLFGCSGDASSLCDRRGAAEALYIFISRFRGEQDVLGIDSNDSDDFKQFKLKILELYKVILNVLKTLSNEEDRWIRGDTASGMRVLSLTALNSEYMQWLRELETDFLQ